MKSQEEEDMRLNRNIFVRVQLTFFEPHSQTLSDKHGKIIATHYQLFSSSSSNVHQLISARTVFRFVLVALPSPKKKKETVLKTITINIYKNCGGISEWKVSQTQSFFYQCGLILLLQNYYYYTFFDIIK